MILRNSFLEQFDPIEEGDWEEIVQGRIARLALKGKLGALDIFVVYLTSGSAGRADRIGWRVYRKSVKPSRTRTRFY